MINYAVPGYLRNTWYLTRTNICQSYMVVFFFLFSLTILLLKIIQKNVQTARRSFAYALTPKRTDIVGLFEFEKRDFFFFMNVTSVQRERSKLILISQNKNFKKL